MTVQHPADEVDAPRVQIGPNPQHLLGTVLGEYLDSSDAAFPASAVVAVLREFDITPASARAALGRLVRRGLLTTRGSGRTTVYHVPPQTITRHRSTMHGFLAFGAEPPPWDGEWTAASFSLSQAQQAERHAVRRTLGTLGFVRLYDSVWICPRADVGPVRDALQDLLGEVDGARWSVMRVRFEDETGPHGPALAYDLAGLAARYREFVDEYAPLRAATRAGSVDAVHALVARTRIMDVWRRFSRSDPDLPAHLLPMPWPRDEARALFLEIHSTLGPLAERGLVELMSPTWPDAASWVTYYVASDDAAAPPRRGGNVSP